MPSGYSRLSSFSVFLYLIINGGESAKRLEARIFSVFLFIILVALELMTLSHLGVKKALSYLVSIAEDGSKKMNWKILIATLFKLGVLLFTVTLETWTYDPLYLTLSGCLIVIAFSVTRVMIYFFIHQQALVEKAMKVARRSAEVARQNAVAAAEVARQNVQQSAEVVGQNAAAAAAAGKALKRQVTN